MKILLVADSLLSGGAEWFLLRQYSYLKALGYSVQLMVTRPDGVDERLLQNFPGVHFFSADRSLIRIAVFADRIMYKIFRKTFFSDYVNKVKIRSLIKRFRPDVIQSHLLQADYKVILANRKKPVRHIITIHGDYIEHIKKKETFFISRIRKVLAAADAVVFISGEQKEILTRLMPAVSHKLVKIYNGYPARESIPGSFHAGFNFGMIARGIPEKGWEFAIQAFQRIKNPGCTLLLFGEGKYLDQLRQKYPDARIHFRGFAHQPLVAIQEMDAGLFPSYYPSESLPTTVIEYLILNKPVITSPVGECREMIKHENELAGIVVNLKNGKPDVDELYAAMNRLITDKDFYSHCCSVASQAKKKFGMEPCMHNYLNLYSGKTDKSCAA